jgi:hypothetical protein
MAIKGITIITGNTTSTLELGKGLTGIYHEPSQRLVRLFASRQLPVLAHSHHWRLK